VRADYAGEGKIAVMPLFVAITEAVDIVFENMTSGEGGAASRLRQRLHSLHRTCPDVHALAAWSARAFAPFGTRGRYERFCGTQ
jgi:hypothetical protein